MKPYPRPVALEPVMEITWWHDSITEEGGYPVAGAYVEKFWLPIVGPSALWLARRLVERLNTTVDMTEMATGIGLAAGLAANSHLTKSVYRLIRFGFVRRAGDTLDVRTHVGYVPQGLLTRCSEELQAEAKLIREAPRPVRIGSRW